MEEVGLKIGPRGEKRTGGRREWLGVLRRRETEAGRVSRRGGEWKRKRPIKADLDFQPEAKVQQMLQGGQAGTEISGASGQGCRNGAGCMAKPHLCMGQGSSFQPLLGWSGG